MYVCALYYTLATQTVSSLVYMVHDEVFDIWFWVDIT